MDHAKNILNNLIESMEHGLHNKYSSFESDAKTVAYYLINLIPMRQKPAEKAVYLDTPITIQYTGERLVAFKCDEEDTIRAVKVNNLTNVVTEHPIEHEHRALILAGLKQLMNSLDSRVSEMEFIENYQLIAIYDEEEYKNFLTKAYPDGLAVTLRDNFKMISRDGEFIPPHEIMADIPWRGQIQPIGKQAESADDNSLHAEFRLQPEDYAAIYSDESTYNSTDLSYLGYETSVNSASVAIANDPGLNNAYVELDNTEEILNKLYVEGVPYLQVVDLINRYEVEDNEELKALLQTVNEEDRKAQQHESIVPRTMNDLTDKLKEKYPDGITVTAYLEPEIIEHMITNTSIGGEIEFQLNTQPQEVKEDLLACTVQVSPEDYDLIEPGEAYYINSGLSKDDYEEVGVSYFMHVEPELSKGEINLPDTFLRSHMQVEGLPIREAAALFLSGNVPGGNKEQTKYALQLMNLMKNGGLNVPAGAKTLELVKEVNTHLLKMNKISDVQVEAIESPQWSGILRPQQQNMLQIMAEKQLLRMDIIKTHPTVYDIFCHNDEKAKDLANNLNNRFNKHPQWKYWDDKIELSFPFPTQPDTLRVVINNSNYELRQDFQSTLRLSTGVSGFQECPWRDKQVCDYLINLAKSGNKITPVGVQGSEGIILSQKGALGYIHITPDRTIDMVGQELPGVSNHKIEELLTTGNLLLSIQGKNILAFHPVGNHCTLMDVQNGKLTNAHRESIDGKQYYFEGRTKEVDMSHHIDISDLLSNAITYGSQTANRMFVKCSINGEPQMAKVLNAEELRGMKNGLPRADAMSLAAKYFVSELIEAHQRSQSQSLNNEEEHANSFKR